jgi:hypothetical protein
LKPTFLHRARAPEEFSFMLFSERRPFGIRAPFLSEAELPRFENSRNVEMLFVAFSLAKTSRALYSVHHGVGHEPRWNISGSGQGALIEAFGDYLARRDR